MFINSSARIRVASRQEQERINHHVMRQKLQLASSANNCPVCEGQVWEVLSNGTIGRPDKRVPCSGKRVMERCLIIPFHPYLQSRYLILTSASIMTTPSLPRLWNGLHHTPSIPAGCGQEAGYSNPLQGQQRETDNHSHSDLWDNQSHQSTYTPICIFVECGQKLENLERTHRENMHTYTGRPLAWDWNLTTATSREKKILKQNN